MGVILVTLPTDVLTTGGVREKLSSVGTNVVKVILTAPSTNTGNIWVGDVAVSATGERGVEIVKGTTLQLEFAGNTISLDNMYFDGASGDSISVSYLQKLS